MPCRACSSVVVHLLAVAAFGLTLLGPDAKACIGIDGTIPPFGGSGPNGIMVKKIEKAWKDAALNKIAPVVPPVSGTHPVLIILIENKTAGVTFAYPSATLWRQRIADVDAYYTEVSRGRFSVSPAAEAYGTSNDGVIGPLKVSGLTSSTDIEGADSAPLAVQAIRAANSYVNFASFDKNHSGTVEPDELHIVIYQAGDEASYSASAVPRAWAHASWRSPCISGLSIASDSDNVNLVSYSYCGSEFNGAAMATMGAMAHELGHDIGLPDLYDVDNTGSGGEWEGLGDFCLMAGGGWGNNGNTPVHLNAFLKNYLGWASLTTITAPGNQPVSLLAAGASNAALRIDIPGSEEFFIVENRQQIGYDTALPGSMGGLAIYHCDDAILYFGMAYHWNNINTDPTDFGIALVEADDGDHLRTGSNRGRDADLYRSGNNAAFTATSWPDSDLKTGSASGVALTNISASATTMSFTVGTPAYVSMSVGRPSVSETINGPVSYVVTYANATAVTLSPENVALRASGTAHGIVAVSGTGLASRTITVSDITGEGRLGIAINAGTATDTFGHVAPAAGPTTGFWVSMNVPVAAWPAIPCLLAAGVAWITRRKRP